MARRIIRLCEDLTVALNTLCRETGTNWTEEQYDYVNACGSALTGVKSRKLGATEADTTWHGLADIPDLGWVYVRDVGLLPPDLRALVRGRIKLQDAIMLGITDDRSRKTV